LAAFAAELLLLALGLFVVTRRLSGAITSPLPPLSLVITALGLLAWSVTVRGLSVRCVASQPARGYIKWLPTTVLLLFAAACSFPASRLIDWFVWLPVFALDWWSATRIAGIKRNRVLSRLAASKGELEPAQPLQQIQRFRTADGAELIRGEFVAEFAAGERNATLYIAFCPPFERLPTVDAQIGDESSATVKVAQLLHNGAELDVRLAEPSATAQVVAVEFIATTIAD
jgi:hypothetical protein